MLFSGMTISANPHIIIGNLYFTPDGEAYIEFQDSKKGCCTRSLVHWCSVQVIKKA